MRVLNKRERGFTLVELLIVVAILGVLAGVAIPNVVRFMGHGEEEAAETELKNIQTAVTAMIVDNAISELPTPVNGVPVGSGGGGVATSNMSAFPDALSDFAWGTKVTDPDGYTYADATDKSGYVLFGHDITGSDPGNANPNQTDANYVAQQSTKGTYIVDVSGTVTQVTTGYK